jgi:hypothetical protein
LQQSVPDAGVVPFLMQNLVTRNDHFDWRLNPAGQPARQMLQLCASERVAGLAIRGPSP